MKNTMLAAALSLPIAFGALITGVAAASPAGTWAMADGKVTVRVDSCGGGLCARIVGLKEPISRIDGKPKVDRENPDPALRGRPLIGLSILRGMRPAGVGQWKGAIYNPDDGRTYKAVVTQKGDTMKVKACVASVLCRTNTFVRIN